MSLHYLQPASSSFILFLVWNTHRPVSLRPPNLKVHFLLRLMSGILPWRQWLENVNLLSVFPFQQHKLAAWIKSFCYIYFLLEPRTFGPLLHALFKPVRGIFFYHAGPKSVRARPNADHCVLKWRSHYSSMCHPPVERRWQNEMWAHSLLSSSLSPSVFAWSCGSIPASLLLS